MAEKKAKAKNIVLTDLPELQLMYHLTRVMKVYGENLTPETKARVLQWFNQHEMGKII